MNASVTPGLGDVPSTKPLTREQRREMAGRINADAETEATAPAPGPASLSDSLAMAIEKLAYNPRNPRNSNPDVSDLESIKDKQVQPGRGVSRGAYLGLWPEDEAELGDAEAITVVGNRRKRACHVYGRPTMDIIIDDSMASSKAEFLKWTMIENVARENLNILEEARGIEAMVTELGTAVAVADALGKTPPFVSQRRSILKLDPVLQKALLEGELAYHRARDLGKLPPEEQIQRWLAEVEAKETAADSEPAESGAPKRKPKPVATPATVKQVTKTFAKWSATPEVLAPALAEYLELSQLRTLMGQLMELTVKLNHEGKGPNHDDSGKEDED